MNTLSFQPPSVSRLYPCGGPDTYCIFSGFFLSLLAKIFPRIMKKSMYSSCIQSGGFWNELTTGEFLSNFFFPPTWGKPRAGARTLSCPGSPPHHACGPGQPAPSELLRPWAAGSQPRVPRSHPGNCVPSPAEGSGTWGQVIYICASIRPRKKPGWWWPRPLICGLLFEQTWVLGTQQNFLHFRCSLI